MQTHSELLAKAVREIEFCMNETDMSRFELLLEVDAVLTEQLKAISDYESAFIGEYVKKYFELMETIL